MFSEEGAVPALLTTTSSIRLQISSNWSTSRPQRCSHCGHNKYPGCLPSGSTTTCATCWVRWGSCSVRMLIHPRLSSQNHHHHSPTPGKNQNHALQFSNLPAMPSWIGATAHLWRDCTDTRQMARLNGQNCSISCLQRHLYLFINSLEVYYRFSERMVKTGF